jgi:hypothetical protein
MRLSAAFAATAATAAAFALFASAAPAAGQTDAGIRQQIIRASIAAYPGSCPCPYNVDRAGRRCGGRSAWSRPGGYAPRCYPRDVTIEEVAAYRAGR